MVSFFSPTPSWVDTVPCATCPWLCSRVAHASAQTWHRRAAATLYLESADAVRAIAGR